jgi:hypothetical protein
MLPLLLAMDATKKGLLAFVQQMGMAVLSELLAVEAVEIAGPKGKQVAGRTHHHWGTTSTPIAFGGRNVSIERPRVRARGKGKQKEVELPTIEALREGDPMSARVTEQILAGVSTRGYERSLEPLDPTLNGRGASKSNASRALVDVTTEKLAAFVSRKLDDVDLVAMFIDGIVFAGHTMIVALGVTIDGTKVPLGLWGGSTENAVLATALVQNLVERGLRIEHSMLFVIDGGKGLRKALRDVFGDRAIVQRCQGTSCETFANTCPRRVVGMSRGRCATHTKARPLEQQRSVSCSSLRGSSRTAKPAPPRVCVRAWTRPSRCFGSTSRRVSCARSPRPTRSRT